MQQTAKTASLRSCRVCLNYSGDDFYHLLDPLYEAENETDGKNGKIPTQLDCFNKCTQLQVTEQQLKTETWTARYLCSSCKQDLERSYHFINRAQLSDEILKNHAFTLKRTHRQRETSSTNETEQVISEHLQTIHYALESLETLKAEENNTNVDDQLHFDLHKNERNESNLERIEITEVLDDTEEGEEVQYVEAVDENALLGDCDYKIEKLDEEFTECVDDEDNETKTCNTVTEEYQIQIAVDAETDEADSEAEAIALETDDEDTTLTAETPSSDVQSKLPKYFEFNCELCPEKYKYQSPLLEHYELQHSDGSTSYQCEKCQKYCPTKFALRVHIRQEHMNGKYVDCNICGRMVLDTFHKVHLQRHGKKTKFLCNICPSTFSSKHVLMKHMSKHSNERNRQKLCTVCGREFYTLENLQAHMETHQSERVIFSCQLCPKTFLRRTNLKLHMQWHRGETMNCPHCNKEFVRPKDLEVHIRFHTGNFPYACSICDRRFAIKSHMNDHVKKHLGIRYKCPLCEKDFINYSGLKQHSFEHTGMPFACDICKRGFPTKFKIRRHLRSVHKDLFADGYTPDVANIYILENKKNMDSKNVAFLSMHEEYVDMMDVNEENEIEKALKNE